MGGLDYCENGTFLRGPCCDCEGCISSLLPCFESRELAAELRYRIEKGLLGEGELLDMLTTGPIGWEDR